MESGRKSFGYVAIATVVILVIAIFACVSVIPTAKASVAELKYYVNLENPSPPNFYRSTEPFNFYTTNYDYRQSSTSSHGILTTLTPLIGGTGGYADLGLGYTFGKLGDITSIPIAGNGSYAVNIYIDMNTTNDVGGNGPFFNWAGNAFKGLDGDEYGLGTTQITNSGTITPATSFMLVSHGNNTYTILQLQSGAVAGIDGNTIVGFWFGITYQMNTQFEIDLISGHSVDCLPVGGETVPINTVQGLVRLVGSATVMSAIVTSFVGFRRMKRKEN